jgi:leucyl aminopeptidase
MVALGPTTAGIFSDDDALAEDIKTIGKRAGEDFWGLPRAPVNREPHLSAARSRPVP